MQVAQLITQAVDIADWRRHEEFAEYPEGAREKTFLYCPVPPPYNFLRGNHRYLFKLSSSRCPEQFWIEVFAYLLGNAMDIAVPLTFVAYDSKKNQSGALVEWFLESLPSFNNEIYRSGGDYCQQYIPNFDRKKGKQHNFETISKIFEDLNKKYPQLNIEWKNYWAKALTFDALIGNIDRHQDNWGIILVPSYSEEISFEKIHISPVFDNGSSMGYEILARNFKQYEDNPKLEKYISKGKHHMKWSINDTLPMGHLEMLKKLASIYPETRQLMLDCLKKVNYDTFKSILDTLTLFDVPVRLTTDRANFMLKLIQFRQLRLLQELEK